MAVGQLARHGDPCAAALPAVTSVLGLGSVRVSPGLSPTARGRQVGYLMNAGCGQARLFPMEGQSSPQPIVTMTSGSWPVSHSSSGGRCR